MGANSSADSLMHDPKFSLSAQRGLLLGLGWVNEHLQEFSVGGPDSDPFSTRSLARMKPISELALTIWILKRCGAKISALDEIAAWIWRECDDGRLLIRLLLARNDFLPCCALYAPLFQLGYRSRDLHAVARMLSQSDMARSLPLQPWARLALDYNLWQLGFLRRPTAALRDLYVLGRPEPWVISGEVAYAITHEVFYLSDFGFLGLRTKHIDEYLTTWVPYWTRAFVHECDNDVAGELAMIWSCIGGDAETSQNHPLKTVLDHQTREGAVPGPDGAGSFLFAEKDSTRRRGFLTNYHTTLVTLMAAALALRGLNRRRSTGL
jgi:hypothetical protein